MIDAPLDVILLNGPFGVGKTTASRLISEAEHWPEIDLEIFGDALHHLFGTTLPREDFQCYRSWSTGVAAILEELAAQLEVRTLLVPMTIWRPAVFSEMLAGTERIAARLFPIFLTADESTLRARILSRPPQDGDPEWCLRYLGTIRDAGRDGALGVIVDTTHLTPQDVADAVCLTVRKARDRGGK